MFIPIVPLTFVDMFQNHLQYEEKKEISFLFFFFFFSFLFISFLNFFLIFNFFYKFYQATLLWFQSLILSFCVCRETIISRDYGHFWSITQGQTNNGEIHRLMHCIVGVWSCPIRPCEFCLINVCIVWKSLFHGLRCLQCSVLNVNTAIIHLENCYLSIWLSLGFSYFQYHSTRDMKTSWGRVLHE